VMGARNQVSAAGGEWSQQQPQQFASTLSRAQVIAEYMATRDESRATNSEDSGSSYFAQARTYTPRNMMASTGVR